ncbi:MAG: hypothetical protein ACRDN0_08100 [Trebonia sp.]
MLSSSDEEWVSAFEVKVFGALRTIASSYAASAEEKERLSKFRVHCSTEAIMRKAFDNPTPEQLARWQRTSGVDHPWYGRMSQAGAPCSSAA